MPVNAEIKFLQKTFSLASSASPPLLFIFSLTFWNYSSLGVQKNGDGFPQYVKPKSHPFRGPITDSLEAGESGVDFSY